jgi:hypothetical protein
MVGVPPAIGINGCKGPHPEIEADVPTAGINASAQYAKVFQIGTQSAPLRNGKSQGLSISHQPNGHLQIDVVEHGRGREVATDRMSEECYVEV